MDSESQEDEILDEKAINFYLSSLQRKVYKKEKGYLQVHIFDTTFYPTLSSCSLEQFLRKPQDLKPRDIERITKVKTMFQNMSILEKKLTFIPVKTLGDHWFIAVIYMPLTAVNQMKEPLILLLDGAAPSSWHSETANLLRLLLSYDHLRHHGLNEDFSDMRAVSPEMPPLKGGGDSALYMLLCIQICLTQLENFEIPSKSRYKKHLTEEKMQELKNTIRKAMKCGERREATVPEPKPAVASVRCCYCGADSSSLEQCQHCKRRLIASTASTTTSGGRKPIMMKRKMISKENDSPVVLQNSSNPSDVLTGKKSGDTSGNANSNIGSKKTKQSSQDSDEKRTSQWKQTRVASGADSKTGRQLSLRNHGSPSLQAAIVDPIIVTSSPQLQNLGEELLVYPFPPLRGEVIVHSSDLHCLRKGQYLNDSIIEFYLKHLMLEQVSPRNRGRTYVFNTFFFKSLTRNVLCKEPLSRSRAEAMHSSVKSWTKNIDIFEKDFVVIPINDSQHWFVVIICFPGLKESTPMKSGGKSSYQSPIKRPLLLILDSLDCGWSKSFSYALRGYLMVEHLHKRGELRDFKDLEEVKPKLPQQTNSTDCGVFMLQYVESFFKKPIKDFKDPRNLENWFPREIIKLKRKEISKLIMKLVQENKKTTENEDEIDSVEEECEDDIFEASKKNKVKKVSLEVASKSHHKRKKQRQTEAAARRSNLQESKGSSTEDDAPTESQGSGQQSKGRKNVNTVSLGKRISQESGPEVKSQRLEGSGHKQLSSKSRKRRSEAEDTSSEEKSTKRKSNKQIPSESSKMSLQGKSGGITSHSSSDKKFRCPKPTAASESDKESQDETQHETELKDDCQKTKNAFPEVVPASESDTDSNEITPIQNESNSSISLPVPINVSESESEDIVEDSDNE